MGERLVFMRSSTVVLETGGGVYQISLRRHGHGNVDELGVDFRTLDDLERIARRQRILRSEVGALNVICHFNPLASGMRPSSLNLVTTKRLLYGLPSKK